MDARDRQARVGEKIVGESGKEYTLGEMMAYMDDDSPTRWRCARCDGASSSLGHSIGQKGTRARRWICDEVDEFGL